MDEFWWVKYFGKVSEDEYFHYAFNESSDGEAYNRMLGWCRYNRVKVINYLVAYPKYFGILEEDDPILCCPLYLKDLQTNENFIGYFMGGLVYEVHDYDVVSVVE